MTGGGMTGGGMTGGGMTGGGMTGGGMTGGGMTGGGMTGNSGAPAYGATGYAWGGHSDTSQTSEDGPSLHRTTIVVPSTATARCSPLRARFDAAARAAVCLAGKE